jgi:SAM-dependent methyltransferase
MIGADDLRQFCRSAIPHPSAFDDTMINEAAFGLSRLLPALEEQRARGRRLGRQVRVLEVGAGSLILSSYLAVRGLEVTAVEPATGGFEKFNPLQQTMLDAVAREGVTLAVVRQPIEDLRLPAAFDFVLSVNALEHMREPYAAIDIMYGALAPDGALFVHCPNYDVPFDSHFGIFLITLRKSVNERIYGRRLDVPEGCWEGLTFIRQSDVRRHCRARGYPVVFNRQMLVDAVRRLDSDPIFSERMPALVRRLGRVLASRAVAPLLTSVPLRWQTPMEFVVPK